MSYVQKDLFYTHKYNVKCTRNLISRCISNLHYILEQFDYKDNFEESLKFYSEFSALLTRFVNLQVKIIPLERLILDKENQSKEMDSYLQRDLLSLEDNSSIVNNFSKKMQ